MLNLSNRSALVILNTHSGDADKKKIRQAIRSMAATLGVKCDIVAARTVSQVSRAARNAARSDYDVVIAAGGDGTINAIARKLAGTGKPMGLLPVGTFNYFARELEVPSDLAEAFRACFEGETRDVTVGEVNGRMFLNNASIGLYPMILSIRERVYQRWGRKKIAAYWSVLKALVRPHLNLDLTISAGEERRRVRTPMMFVARNAVQLEDFRIPGTACVAGDGFSVYILKPMGKLGLLRVAWRVATRKLAPEYDFDMLCARELRVDSRRILRHVAFDGERVKMLAPLEFRVRRHALTVVVPRTGTTRKEKEIAA
jgi:diacylglycerol kinase family enzyme